jgi:hypothetical protein
MGDPLEVRAEPLVVPANPCSTCPYACDTPAGIWAPEEYDRLADFDTNARTGTFLCHHSPVTGREAVCRGWLAVHAESVAVRLAVLLGAIPPGAPYEPMAAAVYATGTEARDAGRAGIDEPTPEAQTAIVKLAAQRARAGVPFT